MILFQLISFVLLNQSTVQKVDGDRLAKVLSVERVHRSISKRS